MDQPCPSPRLLRPVDNPRARVLFLGYGPDQTPLPAALADLGCAVWQTDGKIQSTEGYDLVVSFGYRHIIGKQVIDSSPAPIVNLHIAYLPWNRGAHPNFWSFFDCTPSGVTIHLIDEGVDTGAILYQRYVNFAGDETTFAQTYRRLIREIEALFLDHMEDIVAGRYQPRAQRRKGSYHRAGDLPKDFAGWDSDIEAEIRRLDALLSMG